MNTVCKPKKNLVPDPPVLIVLAHPQAKHHAMVAQAHAAQRGSSSSQSLGEVASHLNIVEVEGPASGGVSGFAPKPPVKPAPSRSKPGLHRLTR